MEQCKYSLDELRVRSRPVINNPDPRIRIILVETARASPNSAYKEALAKTGSIRKAKATRFLAILRRDYGEEEFDGVVRSNRREENLESFRTPEYAQRTEHI